MFCKKGVLRNFAKFTGKYLCQSLFFNKVAGLRPATLLKKRLWHRCLPVNFGKFLRTPFLIEQLWWLLLSSHHKQANNLIIIFLSNRFFTFFNVKTIIFFDLLLFRKFTFFILSQAPFRYLGAWQTSSFLF